MPERIQLRRTKGWRLPPNARSVARPGPWGNPFVVGREVLVQQYPEGAKEGFGCSMLVTPEIAVALFRARTLCHQENVREIRATLAGLDLACWCKIGDPCHADVLLEIANPPAEAYDCAKYGHEITDMCACCGRTAYEIFGGEADWPEPARCRSTTAGGVRCGLPDRHVLSGPRSHCANPTRGDGSTWTGPGFVQWRDEPP